MSDATTGRSGTDPLERWPLDMPGWFSGRKNKERPAAFLDDGSRAASLNPNVRYPPTMRTFLLALAVFLTASACHAVEYGHYDPKRMLTVADSASGKKYGVDGAYLDRMLNDLALHAGNYPPRFDTQEDRQRAIQDVRMLSGMLDVLTEGPTAHPDLLKRAGLVNSIGHNLDVAGSAAKAASMFQRLLAAAPSDPRGNFMYGTFLASAGKPKEALPYLEKALAVGVAEAAYTIGMTHLTLGDKGKALEYLEAYGRRSPGDGNVGRLIDAIRNGKIEFKKSPS